MNARVMATLLVVAGQAWAGCGPLMPKDESTPLTIGQAVVKIEKSGLGAVVKAEVKAGVFVITLADGMVVRIEPAGPKKDVTTAATVEERFTAAKALFREKKYEEAAEAYEDIAARFPNQESALAALGGAIQCYAAMGSQDRVLDRLSRVESLLPKHPQEFGAKWQKWLIEVKRELGAR
jgi:hypothetical protein